MQTIRMETSDGVDFHVDRPIANMFDTVSELLENIDPAEEYNGFIPLQNIRSEIFTLVLQYAEYHRWDPEPVQEDEESREKRTDDICAWDVRFLDVSQQTLFDLVLAANFLDFKKLMAATCKTIANMIKGKTSREIADHFDRRRDVEDREEEEEEEGAVGGVA